MSTPTEDPEKQDHRKPAQFTVSDKTANRLITVVTSMWVLNILAGIPEALKYEPSDLVHGAFMVVLGFIFTVRVRG